MPKHEYKVVPAPKKGLKGKGVKGTEERFANALVTIMNDLGAEGWEYQRSDTLPCEERSGMMGKSTVFLNMLVFRREAQLVKSETSLRANLNDDADADSKPHTPLFRRDVSEGADNAPKLGPATKAPTEAAEVKDPRAEPSTL